MAPILGSVLRQLGLFFAALALFSMAGGHWAVLQTVAWAGMLHDYTQSTGSVAMAVERTFDGQHPCELCLQIAAAKQQEKTKDHSSLPGGEKTSKAEKSQKATALEHWSFASFQQATVSRGTPPSENVLLSRTDQPPTPPPRGIVGV